MDNTVIVAFVAAASAVIGGLATAVIGPLVKHRLEQASEERSRRRSQIAVWRQMILDIDRDVAGNQSPGELIQVHPDYITLEPYLSDEARLVAVGPNFKMVVGQALCVPLERLKDEVARIEKEWKL